MTDIFLYGPATPSVDIILCDPTVLCAAVVSLPSDDKPRGKFVHPPPGHKVRRAPQAPVVVAESLMADLLARYGPHGADIYFAMEREHKGPFGPGQKYDATQRPLQPVATPAPKRRVPVLRPPAAREQ